MNAKINKMHLSFQGAGKTTFIKKLIQKQHYMLSSPAKRIVYFYIEMNDQIKAISKLPRVELIKHFDQDVIDDHKSTDDSLWIIVDDHLLQNVHEKLADIFTVKSAAKKISISYLSQNIFTKIGNAQKYNRELLLNSTITILFNNRRDESLVTSLARTSFASRFKFFKGAYHAVCGPGKSAHNYLAIFSDPDTPPELELRSKIFFRDQTTILLWQRK